MPDIANGESVKVTGSKGDVYVLGRRGNVYTCTCPAWKHGKGAEANRRCKHLNAYLGESTIKPQPSSINSNERAQDVADVSKSTREPNINASLNNASAASEAMARPSRGRDPYTDLEVKPRRRGIFRSEFLDRAEKHLNQKNFDQAEETLDTVGQQLNRGSIFTDGTGERYNEDWQRWYQLRQRLIRERRDFETLQAKQNKEARHEPNHGPVLRLIGPNSEIDDNTPPQPKVRSDSSPEQSDSRLSRLNNNLIKKKELQTTTALSNPGASGADSPKQKLSDKEWTTWLYTLPVTESALYEFLDRDREFLEQSIWEMFESAGARQLFAGRSGYYCVFNSVVLRLAQDGRIDRRKLLDYSIQAISKLPEPYSNEHFVKMYSALKPSIEERTEHRDHYSAALRSKQQIAINWGLKQITELFESGLIHSSDALAAVSNTRLTTQNTFMSVIGLAKSIAKKDKETRARATMIMATMIEDGLTASLQKAVVDAIIKYGDQDDSELVKLMYDRINKLSGIQLQRAQSWLAESPAAASIRLDISSADSNQIESVIEELLAQLQQCEKRFLAATKIDEAIGAVRGERDIPGPVDCDPSTLPLLSDSRLVEPIDNINDLIYSFLRIVDRKTTGEEIERVVDGLSRLCTDRPLDFSTRVKSLKDRAIQRLQPEEIQDQTQLRQTEPFGGVSDQEDLAALALIWTDGRHLSEYYRICPRLRKLESLNPEAGRNTLAGITINSFFAARMCALALQVLRKKALPSLAAPTHKGGWIDPRVIGDRLRQFAAQGEEPNHCDTIQALLRLAPLCHDQALENLKEVEGEIADAFRYALGAKLPSTTTKGWLWGAAARARAPFEDDVELIERFPELPPDTVKTAEYSYTHEDARFHYAFMGDTTGRFLRPKGYPAPVNNNVVEFPTYLFHCKPYNMEFEMQYFNKRVWESLVWPQSRESYFAGEARQVLQYINSQGRYWLTDWEPLFDPDTYANGMARYLIALGLSAKHEACVRQAIDALKTVIEDCRLDGHSFGEALATVFDTETIVLGRWFSAFDEVVQVSSLHKLVLKRALEGVVKTLHPLKTVPQKLLPKMYSLAWDCGEAIQNTRARAVLELLEKKGNQQARKLLMLKTDPHSTIRKEAALQTLERRIDRALRWQSII